MSDDLVLLPCGHCFHKACVGAAVGSHSSCPSCQKPATAQMLLSGGKQFKVYGPLNELRTSYGSKLACVIETLQAIQKREGQSVKCVVAIQWDTIASHLERGLKNTNVMPIMLRGNALQRQKLLLRFIESQGA